MTWLGILGLVLATVWSMEIVAVIAATFGRRPAKAKASTVTASV